MASTDEKKRTQEASETDFTTRGGRQDATAGTGKPHTSPCKRAPEIPDEAGTVNGEQAPAASLAWVLTTCAETVVECTDKVDFADACVAVGPGHCSQLQTETVPRLLLRENRELVIEQGRGWAENDQPFQLTVSQHLAAVREWIAFEEDGRGLSAERWVQEDINRHLDGIKLWQGYLERYDPDKPSPYEKKDPRPRYEQHIRDHEADLKRIRERGFETAPADPRRAALLSRLEATVYCHGAIHVPADMDNGGEYQSRGNSKETCVVVSLGAPDGRRTLFVCSAAEGNICDAGCWCAGHEMYSVHALLEGVADDAPPKGGKTRAFGTDQQVLTKRPDTECEEDKEETETGLGWVRVLAYDFSNGNAGGMGAGLYTATEGDAARLTARLGVDASDLGTAVRLVVLAANVKGAGRKQWGKVEQAHVDPKRFDYDSDCGYNVETWPDNPRPDDYRVRGVCGAGAVVTFPRIGPADAERKEPQFERSMMRSCGESPRGILKSLKKKVSEALEPAALESLPRLVGALPGSYYLHDIIDEIDEAHYQRELKQFKKYSPDKDPDPEEEEYWRHETKHSIS